MTDQQLALQAMSDAQHILKNFYSLGRTMISGSLKGWWRYLSDQTLLWLSIACNVPMAAKKPAGLSRRV